MGDVAGELTEVVRRSGRRRRRAEARARALTLLSPGVLLVALAVVVVQSGLLSALFAGVLAVLVLLALSLPALGAVFRPVHDITEAKHLDDALGLKDRLASALSFLRNRERTPFEHAAVLDAHRFLPRFTARRETGVRLREPLLRLAAAAVVALVLVGGAHIVFRLTGATGEEMTPPRGERRAADLESPSGDQTPETTEPEPSDEDLVEVEDTKLTEETVDSAFSDAEREEMAALAASETSEADRLLQQAAYLDETDLDDSGLGRDGTTDDDERVTMKEPDMDMIREMIKEAQKRKKEGKEQDQGADDIKLEVLIKSHAAASTKRPPKRPRGRRSSSGGGGPSQDTRIKPRRVRVDAKVEFKITSVRSLTPGSATGAKRIVLSEAIMRTSGVPEVPLVEARTVAVGSPKLEPKPVVTQPVPPELRAYISKYFEGLRQLKKAP